jgi:amidophosphoribosyltransferase
MRRIVKMIQELGPKEVHLAIFSPPVAHPCFYGIDMPSKNELVASKYPADELESALAKTYGVSSLSYVSEKAILDAAEGRMCTACFTGQYPIPVSAAEQAAILKNRGAEAPV